jgi:hypothetical protein
MSDLRAFSPSNDDRASQIDELCALVEDRARSLGHRLDQWQDAGEGMTTSRRTMCTVCGRVAYVRIEGGLLGAAGPACSEDCSSPK